MKKILISIIIPTYNRAHLISETLDSVLAQAYEHWECIVVDDGSTDHTDAILNDYCKKDNRIQYHHRPKDRLKGANACRNYGFEKAVGQYIQWFDSDDLMHPDLLQLQLQNIQTTKKAISICNFCFFRNLNDIDNSKPFNVFDTGASNQKLLTSFVSGTTVLNTQAVFFYKNAVKDIRFDEQLHRAQDLDFVFKAFSKNIESISNLDTKLVFIRRHKQSITDAFKNREREAVYSEVTVRYRIWSELKDEKISKESMLGALKMYLQSLKHLLYINNYTVFLKKLAGVFKIVNNKLKLLVLKLYCLAIVYIFTKRGLTAYQKVINQI